ncbi:GntR family transcriptional regulator [Devosia sp. SL43]|uniref:GntR family transcriptional regulator n=1 Tax=Devosia sp. SL43 TaxID=2806348 RepID=UPI001F48968B|nr:GntR family transcriptional regulator [Devosia sp. SL43]UJW85693.1 GntR family transcriptional regulator [Devosia sp. SL43]
MSGLTDRVDGAHRALRQAIIEQALLPGTKLPEDELGRHFGMSRTLVRAALARLQAQGLVDTSHKRTATVAQPSLEEARDAFAVRRALEREAVRLVVQRWSKDFDTTLTGHVQQEIEAFQRSDTRVSTRLAGEFHLLLAGMSGNALLERYLSELVSRCSLILAVYSRPHSAECAVNEHSAIIEALRNGDAESAERLMESHLGLVESRALIGDIEVKKDLSDILGRYTANPASAPPLRTRAKRS